MVERSGTCRDSNGETVEYEVALAAWTTAARPILLTAAGHYGDLVTFKELAAAVQTDADITTTQLMRQWIGSVLGGVAEQCHQKGEPLLSAFCIQADGTVGATYPAAVLAAYGETPEDPDQHAADERFKAHTFFGAEMPAKGGRSQLPPQEARRRARARAAIPRVVRPMCPNCFVELPVNGPCGLCAE